MKYLFFILAFLMLSALLDLGRASIPQRQGQSLYGLDVFNTGAFDCTIGKQVNEAEWVNEIGDIRIYNAKTWYGASGNTVADIGVIIYRESDEAIFFHENWDHYVDPSGLHVSGLGLTPNYIALEKGDKINMAYWCETFNGKGNRAHIIVTIWFSK